MGRTRSKKQRKKSKTDRQTITALKSKQASGQKLSQADKNAISDIKTGQMTVGLTALTDAFIFGAAAIGKKDAIRSDRKFKTSQLVGNAATLEGDAEDIIESGKEQADEISRQGQQDASSLKARLASQGVQVDFGTGGEGVEDILRVSGQDASAFKMNAFKRAHNIKLQATELRSQANLTRIASKKEEHDTMLTGGLNALRSVSTGIAAADGFSAFTFEK